MPNQSEHLVDIKWVEDSLKFAGEGRTNTVKPDLLANLFNRVLKQAQERAYEAGVIAEHKSHGDFEGELYATLVDPVAEGQIKEAEMRKQLLESARWYRQHVHDLENQLNNFVAASRRTIEGWSNLAKEWDEEDKKQFDGPEFLYTRSIRVQVLLNCLDALRNLGG